MIVSIGNPSIDNVSISNETRVQPGGASVYSALSASIFSHSAIVGKVGQDYPKNFISQFEKNAIDVSHLKAIHHRSKSFDIVIDSNLEAKYPRYDIGIDSKLTYKDIPTKFFDSKNSFIITQMAPKKQLHFAEKLKKESPASLVLVNTHYPFIEKHKSTFPKLINSCDIFVMNEREAQKLTCVARTDIATHILSKNYPKTLIIVTLGALGSVVIKNRQVQFAPSIYSANVKDPTGTGDSFSGAFLSSYSIVMDPVRSAIVGNTIASIKSEKRGFDALLGFKLKDVRSLWDYVLLRSKNADKSQKILFDFR